MHTTYLYMYGLYVYSSDLKIRITLIIFNFKNCSGHQLVRQLYIKKVQNWKNLFLHTNYEHTRNYCSLINE